MTLTEDPDLERLSPLRRRLENYRLQEQMQEKCLLDALKEIKQMPKDTEPRGQVDRNEVEKWLRELQADPTYGQINHNNVRMTRMTDQQEFQPDIQPQQGHYEQVVDGNTVRKVWVSESGAPDLVVGNASTVDELALQREKRKQREVAAAAGGAGTKEPGFLGRLKRHFSNMKGRNLNVPEVVEAGAVGILAGVGGTALGAGEAVNNVQLPEVGLPQPGVTETFVPGGIDSTAVPNTEAPLATPIANYGTSTPAETASQEPSKEPSATQPEASQTAEVFELPEPDVNTQNVGDVITLHVPDLTDRGNGHEELDSNQTLSWKEDLTGKAEAGSVEFYANVFKDLIANSSEVTSTGETFAEALGLPTDATLDQVREKVQELKNSNIPLPKIEMKDQLGYDQWVDPNKPIEIHIVGDPEKYKSLYIISSRNNGTIKNSGVSIFANEDQIHMFVFSSSLDSRNIASSVMIDLVKYLKNSLTGKQLYSDLMRQLTPEELDILKAFGLETGGPNDPLGNLPIETVER